MHVLQDINCACQHIVSTTLAAKCHIMHMADIGAWQSGCCVLLTLDLLTSTDCMQGSTTGHIRFDTPEQAKIALDNTDDGKVVICDCPAFVKLLEGTEEHEFFERVAHTCTACC